MYFFSLWPPLWVVTRFVTKRLFIYIEKMFFMCVGSKRQWQGTGLQVGCFVLAVAYCMVSQYIKFAAASRRNG
jgi:hypothetical protein